MRAARQRIRRRRERDVTPFAERLHRWTAGIRSSSTRRSSRSSRRGQLRSARGAWTGWDVEELQRAGDDSRSGARAPRRPARPRRGASPTSPRCSAREATHDELAAVSELGHDALIAAIDELRAGRRAQRARGRRRHRLRLLASAPAGNAVRRARAGAHANAARRDRRGARAALRRQAPSTHAGRWRFTTPRGDTRRLAAKAVQYLRAAGRDASAKYANREAADYLATALDARGATPTTRRCANRRGPRAGARAPAARRLRRRARALAASAGRGARAQGDVARVASIERSIGLARYWSGAFDDALAHYDAAIDAARAAGDRSLEARVLHREGELPAGDRPHGGRRARRSRLRSRSPRRLGDAGLLARAHRALLLLHVWTGPADEAREARRAGDRDRRRNVGAAECRVVGALGAGDARRTHGQCGRSARRHLADAHRDSPTSCGRRCSACGRRRSRSSTRPASASGITRCRSPSGRSTMARSLGQRTLLPRLLVWLGLLYLGRGDIERGTARVSTKRGSCRGGGAIRAREVATYSRRRAGAHRARGVSPGDARIRRGDRRRRARASRSPTGRVTSCGRSIG